MMKVVYRNLDNVIHMSNDPDLYDWWKIWVPDPAKKYVGEPDPVKINQIYILPEYFHSPWLE
jgi:hypothetical protein